MSSVLFPAGINLLIVYNRSTKTRYEICSKLIVKTPERDHWRYLIEPISQLALEFLLLSLNFNCRLGLTLSIHNTDPLKYFLFQ